MSLAKLIVKNRALFVTPFILLFISGCSDYKFLKLNEQTTAPITPKTDIYDDHYGMPKPSNNGGYATQAKYQYKKITHAALKANAPARYKVKKGDTLWGISNKFLKNPWFWPEIWYKNQRIKNPHLIYPGDLLTIYQTHRTVRQGSRVVEVIVPQIRLERRGSGKPISTLVPFLAWPRVLDANTVDSAPYIIDGQNKHLLIEDEETVYIKNLQSRVGQTYPIFRKSKPLYDPETRELLGYEVIYTADASITQAKGGVASAIIKNTRREVHVGDHLLRNFNEKIHLDAPTLAPRHKVRATVLALYEAELISGTGMVVTLDFGVAEGAKPGHILGVYKQGKTVNDPYETVEQVKYKYLKTKTPLKVDLPPERIATAVVYKVAGRISYALITDSNHPVKKGYKIGNP